MPNELVDRLGRPLRPFMQPDERRGKPAPNAGREFPAQVYAPAELERLVRAGGESRIPAIAARDQASIALMWRAGLRIAEVCALEPRDLDLDQGLVEVRRGKGAKRRVVPIDPQGAAVLAEWLELRQTLNSLPDELLCNVLGPYQGFGVTPVQLRKTLGRLGAKAEIRRRMHPHGLRHTYAFELKREGIPEPVIQLLLGHSQLQTTLHYVNHTLPGETTVVIARRRWPAQIAQHSEAASREVGLPPIPAGADLADPIELRARVAELEHQVAERDRALVRLAIQQAA